MGRTLPDGLLERDAPLAQLRLSARQMARSGQGEGVLLRGEAGVGKTTLLARFVSQLDPGLRVSQNRWAPCRGHLDKLGVDNRTQAVAYALQDRAGVKSTS